MIPGPLRADCPPRMHPLAAAVWSPYWVVNAVEIQKFGGARVYRFWFESDPPFRGGGGSNHFGVFCCWMYWRMVSISAPPVVPQ